VGDKLHCQEGNSPDHQIRGNLISKLKGYLN
jgi:hypothetical protein